MNSLRIDVRHYSVPITINYNISRNNIDKPLHINSEYLLVFYKKWNVSHRKNLPAEIGNDFITWRKNGRKHNLYGPAVISNINGICYYYLNDTQYPKESWEGLRNV